MKKALTLLAIGALFAGSVQAALVMEIDTANEQFRITGSDTGTSEYDVDLGYVAMWGIGYPGGPAGPELIYLDNSSDLFSQTFQMEGLQVHRPESSSLGLTTLFATSDSEFTSVTGSETWFGYSGMDDDLKIYFELTIGGTLNLTSLVEGDYGWSPISVVQTVPEPATASLLGISAAALWLFRRRFMI